MGKVIAVLYWVVFAASAVHAAPGDFMPPNWRDIKLSAVTTISFPLDNWRDVVSVAGRSSAAPEVRMIRGEKWITLNRDEVGMLGMSSQQMSDVIRQFSGSSVQVLANYSRENNQLRIHLVRMERRPDGKVYISYGDYTPHHGERFRAYRQFLTRAEKAIPGTPGFNPFKRFRCRNDADPSTCDNTDPVFYNIDGAGILTAIGYAMREYKAPTAWLAMSRSRLATRTESSGNFFRRRVKTFVEGFVRPTWYFIGPEQMIPAAVTETPIFTGQICVDSSHVRVISPTKTDCDAPEHYAYAGIWAQEWTGGNLPEAEAKIYEWSTERRGFTILAFALTLGPLFLGDPSTYGLLSTVSGSGGSITQAQDGFLGSTGDGFLTVTPPRSEQEEAFRAKIVNEHLTPDVDGGLPEVTKLYTGGCAKTQSGADCAAAGQDPGIVYRVDSYVESNLVMTARDRYDQCKLAGFTGDALQRCAAPMPAGVFGTP
jgi:hypothetical protein